MRMNHEAVWIREWNTHFACRSFRVGQWSLKLCLVSVSHLRDGDGGNQIGCYCLFGEGNGTPLQYSCLENSMDGGAWKAAVHGVAEGRMWLSDFTFTLHVQALEKEMATHSSVLAWRIPGMGEPGELPSMGSHRVRHDWSDLAAAAATVFHCCSFSLIPPNCQPCPPNCDSEYVITFFSMLKKNYSTVTERTDCRWDLTRFGSKVSKKEKGQDQYTQ